MRGSSRASLAEAKERLAEVLGADGASRGRISPDRLGDELFAVAGLLDSEPGLRRTLSDPAREGRAKAGLAETLLTGKISATALSLVTTLVGARWSGPADLVDATEQLAALSVDREFGPRRRPGRSRGRAVPVRPGRERRARPPGRAARARSPRTSASRNWSTRCCGAR